MNTVYNWTKLDVAIINRKLSNQTFYKHKGVVFYKSLSDSSDVFHVMMNDFISNLGGACFMRSKFDWYLDTAKDHPESIVVDIANLATCDENGHFVMIAFQDKLFQEKHDSIRPFVIAHEMAHLHHGDHLNPENDVEVYKGIPDQEIRADKYARELLDENESAKKMLTMALTKVEATASMTLPEATMITLANIKSSLESRLNAIG